MVLVYKATRRQSRGTSSTLFHRWLVWRGQLPAAGESPIGHLYLPL